MNILFLLIEFIVAVMLVLCYYKFVETRKIKKYTKDNIPVDLKLFIETQNINVKKTSYKKLMKIVAWMNSVDVAIVLLITNIVDNIFFKFLIAIPAIIIILLASYRLAGFIFKKKGLTKNES